jgi:hypothetical protein
MKSKLFFSITLFAGLFFAACKHESKNTLPAATADTKNVKYQCPMDCEKGKLYDQPGSCPVCKMDLKAVAAPDAAAPQTFKMSLITDPVTPAAGKPVKLTFTPGIVEKPGEAVPLDVVHEKKLHLILVSNDLSWFDHQHPEYNGTGLDLDFTFPKGGDYILYADYKPAGAGHQVEKLPVTVSGTAAKPVTYTAVKTTVSVDGYEVSLTPAGGKWLTNNPMHITGSVKKGGKPLDVSAFENYLGAKAHVVMVGLDDKGYEHVHPDVHEGSFDLHTQFAKPGIYRMWLQFQTDGKVHTADFVLKVDEGKAGEVPQHESGGEGGHSGH